ncbi:Phosphinothricin N-acetyltransferase [compost metagenome]
MKELIAIANSREYATLVAGIDAANETSIRFHERLGFKASGIIHKAGYKFNAWQDLALYQLELAGPEHPVEA